MLNGLLPDGYMIREARPGLKLIVYDESRYCFRLTFTIMHELGHALLNHKNHGYQQEIEANFFASQVLAPDAIIYEFKKRRYPVNPDIIKSAFGISGEAAEIKYDHLKQNLNTYSNILDADILKLFKQYLFHCAPYRNNYSNINIYMG